MALNVRQQRFVDGIIAGKPATEAYRAAGYKATGHSAEVSASDLLRHPEVVSEIERRRAKVESKADFDAASVLRRLNKLADRCMQEDEFGRVDSSGANRALELLGKHLRLFVDRIEVGGDADLAKAIAEARERRKATP